MILKMCDKLGPDNRWSEVASNLSLNSMRSLTRVAQMRPKLIYRQAPAER